MMTNEKNRIAFALRLIGILLIVVGIITGLYYGTSDSHSTLYELQGIVGLGLFINGVIWGIVFLGFSEVIMLLQGIYNQKKAPTAEDTPSNNNKDVTTNTTETTKSNVVTDDVKKEISDFYASKGLTVQDIRSSEKEDFYYVTVDGKEEILELGGFKPVIVKKIE